LSEYSLYLTKVLKYILKRFPFFIFATYVLNKLPFFRSLSMIFFTCEKSGLAALISSTRVTITRLLGQLEQEGLIDRLPLHRIIVKQEDIWDYEI